MWPTRWYVFEDLAFAAACGVVGGWEPQTQSSCQYVGMCLGLAGIAHTGFLVRYRPYQSRLDLAFALLNGVGVIFVAALAVATASNEIVDTAAIVQTLIFIAQPPITLAVSLRSKRARKRILQEIVAGECSVAAPLLQVPAKKDDAAEQVANPLATTGVAQEPTPPTTSPELRRTNSPSNDRQAAQSPLRCTPGGR